MSIEVLGQGDGVDRLTSGPPVPLPPGYRGPIMLPGTGRMVYWTGRVAIGLRHAPPPVRELGLCAEQVQAAMLRVHRASLTFDDLRQVVLRMQRAVRAP